jgi:hypothetical protein
MIILPISDSCAFSCDISLSMQAANQTVGHEHHATMSAELVAQHQAPTRSLYRTPQVSATTLATQCEFSLESHMHGEFFGLTDFWRAADPGGRRCPTRAPERSSSQPYPHPDYPSGQDAKSPKSKRIRGLAHLSITTCCEACCVYDSVLLAQSAWKQQACKTCLSAAASFRSARCSRLSLPEVAAPMALGFCMAPIGIVRSGMRWDHLDHIPTPLGRNAGSWADDHRLMMPCQTLSRAINTWRLASGER